jgi:hypothetical protein
MTLTRGGEMDQFVQGWRSLSLTFGLPWRISFLDNDTYQGQAKGSVLLVHAWWGSFSSDGSRERRGFPIG